MYKKTITCKDFNGEEKTEVFYFNLSEPEILDLELDTEGGMEQFIQKIIETEDRQSLVKLFKKLICKAYGVKSADGRRFIKSAELTEEFTQTNFFSALFMEFLSNPDALAEFMNNIVPDNINIDEAKIKAQIAGGMNA